MFKVIVCIALLLTSMLTHAKMIHYQLEADIQGYRGVGGSIDGIKNPDLTAKKGDHVMITIINVNNMPHDIKLDHHGVKSSLVRRPGDKTTVHFTADSDDIYYCSLPGHVSMGMKGRFLISQSEEEEPSETGHDVTKNPADIPAPSSSPAPGIVRFDLEAVTVKGKLDDNSTYEYWTYNGTVPGPLLRVREGDTFVVNLKNLDEYMVHSIDFHAAQMNHGGANLLQVPPGETKTLQFVAKKAGLYVYHCATPHVPTHMAMGMYGMILVEPKEGLSIVEKEFYIMQGEYYTKNARGFDGHHQHDSTRLSEERPTYVVMNGRPNVLTGEAAMKASVGERIRIFFGVGGPNLISSFHVIGEIFDKVYPYGSFDSVPFINVQTVLVPAGGATVVEFVIDEPGHYVLVDHSISRVEKGASAVIDAH